MLINRGDAEAAENKEKKDAGFFCVLLVLRSPALRDEEGCVFAVKNYD